MTAVPLILCGAALLLKVTILDPGVNAPPLLVQLPGRPMFVMVPAAKVPAVSVMLPLRVSVVVLLAPVSDPPLLLTTKLLNV